LPRREKQCYVFWNPATQRPITDIGNLWSKLRDEAGLPGVRIHDLRHSFASHVLQSSGDLRGVQELLGHASIASTQIYTGLDFQHLSRVYEAAHPRARRGAGDTAGPGAAESRPPAAAGNPDG
ncbi:MAG: tyrosine-type recombinase/integrase, partial [Tepidimonas sp.]